MSTERDVETDLLLDVLVAARELLEQGLGSDEGYFPSAGFPITENLRDAVKNASGALCYQRGSWCADWGQDPGATQHGET